MLSEELLYSKGVELKFLSSLKYLTNYNEKPIWRLFNNELEPFSDPSCQLKRTANNNWFRFMVGLWPLGALLGHPWGDLVVPTGWKRWGRFMAFFVPFAIFCSKGQREIVHQAVRKGQLDSLSRGFQMRPGRAADSNYNLCTIHNRSNQLPILPFFSTSFDSSLMSQ